MNHRCGFFKFCWSLMVILLEKFYLLQWNKLELRFKLQFKQQLRTNFDQCQQRNKNLHFWVCHRLFWLHQFCSLDVIGCLFRYPRHIRNQIRLFFESIWFCSIGWFRPHAFRLLKTLILQQYLEELGKRCTSWVRKEVH